MTDEERDLAGDRVVVQLYLIIVALTGVMGFIFGVVAPQGLDPDLFGIVSLPATPFGVAVYGMVTVGAGLGVLLGLVVLVSKRYAEPEA